MLVGTLIKELHLVARRTVGRTSRKGAHQTVQAATLAPLLCKDRLRVAINRITHDVGHA